MGFVSIYFGSLVLCFLIFIVEAMLFSKSIFFGMAVFALIVALIAAVLKEQAEKVGELEKKVKALEDRLCAQEAASDTALPAEQQDTQVKE